MSVKVRIWFLIALFVVGLILIYGTSKIIETRIYSTVTMPQVEDVLRAKYEYGIKSAVDIQAQNLAALLKGVTDKQKIYEIIAKETDYQRFFPSDEGYYFTYTMEGVRVNVPINKSANGKNLYNLKDSKGNLFVQDFIRQARDGGGYIEYYFEKPGAGIQPKLSYTRLIPGTDVLIGTGVYIDDVEREQNRIQSIINDKNEDYGVYLLGILACVLLVLTGGAIAVIRSIDKPLQRIIHTSKEVAAGDLEAKLRIGTHTPKEIKELGQSLKTMVATLKEKIQEAALKGKQAEEGMLQTREALAEAEQAKAAAENARREGMLTAADQLEASVEIISSASAQLSSQIRQSERGASEQASRMTETATAMEEMNATVLEVAQSAGKASDVSTTTRQKAEAGAKVVEKAVNAIKMVQQESLALKDDMVNLGQHAEAISQIMSVISDIADQTNLLALNAAIEAARAGEAGRGFAVVADEVRKLAEKTMASTTDVGNAIKSIQESARKSMAQVDLAVRSIEEATDYASQSGSALAEIVTMVDESADQVRAIATASEEQSASSEEINRSIMMVNTISTETAQAMQSATQAVANLADQAHVLTQLIENLKKA